MDPPPSPPPRYISRGELFAAGQLSLSPPPPPPPPPLLSTDGTTPARGVDRQSTAPASASRSPSGSTQLKLPAGQAFSSAAHAATFPPTAQADASGSSTGSSVGLAAFLVVALVVLLVGLAMRFGSARGIPLSEPLASLRAAAGALKALAAHRYQSVLPTAERADAGVERGELLSDGEEKRARGRAAIVYEDDDDELSVIADSTMAVRRRVAPSEAEWSHIDAASLIHTPKGEEAINAEMPFAAGPDADDEEDGGEVCDAAARLRAQCPWHPQDRCMQTGAGQSWRTGYMPHARPTSDMESDVTETRLQIE